MSRDNASRRELDKVLESAFADLGGLIGKYRHGLEVRELGRVWNVSRGIARIRGLPEVRYEELVRFPGGKMGIAFNLDPEDVAAVLIDEHEAIRAGQSVRRTFRIMDVPVGEGLVGRIVDALGRPVDGKGSVRTSARFSVERPAPAIIDRAPVSVPLQTGIQSVDALIPIGRGQRELILGDRQIGKTAIAIDTMINQRDEDVVCIYCAIGQENSSVAKVVADLRKHDVLRNTIVVVATGDDPPGQNYIAPYAATSMGEYFMEKGRDVLVVYDDLTKHARSYRELSLLLRRPPAREAYPGDIFYIHSRLLERATRLKDALGGGSLTALPIIETQAQNIAAYIPTNLVSITDGQIYLSPRLFGEGVLPAIDIGKSVSRVGGKTQLPAYRAVAGDLRLAHSQFEELETFSRFGARLDEDTRKTLERGRRVREVLKQDQYQPLPVAEQIAVMVAVTEGVLDGVPLDRVREIKGRIRSRMRGELPGAAERIEKGKPLGDEDRKAMVDMARDIVESKA
ncbi:MAG TPA: alternate F1F0 ATPase, F1 subunit alpha [Candidatus Aminicenantes bacterium]|nr:alternate F1F0 ATPase, F1 subunit alpha [Candidatus Aminicenantes bacterium]